MYAVRVGLERGEFKLGDFLLVMIHEVDLLPPSPHPHRRRSSVIQTYSRGPSWIASQRGDGVSMDLSG